MKLSDENNNDNNVNNDFEKGVLLETKPKTKKPSMYNVLLDKTIPWRGKG